jgi:hypothetical protein
MPMNAILCFALTIAPGAPATAGVVYRFETESRSGTVWAAGNHARREYDAKENMPARAEIWKDGGKQVIVLNDADRTYYDSVAYEAKSRRTSASLDAMTVRAPFEIAEVKNIQVDVRRLSAPAAGGCRPVKAEFSYILRLRVKAASGTFHGRVDGVDELCLADGLPLAVLPFGHGPALTARIEPVDRALAERFAPLGGLPVRRKISVIRRIEGGANVTSRLELKDMRSAEIPAARFMVPSGYRFQEPVIVAPRRPD